MSQTSSTPLRFASLVLVLVMSACGKDPQSPPSPSHDTPTPPTEAPDATLAPIDTAPRPRSDPPRRPPLPEGIQRFDKDVITLSLSGDGRYLAGGDLAGKSLLWDLSSGRFLWGDPTPEGNRIGRVVFADTGDIWIGGSFDEPDRPWRAWSASALERRGEFGAPNEVAIDLALDEKAETAVVLTSTTDGSRQVVSVWKLAVSPSAPTTTPLWSTSVPESRRGAVAISPDGTQVAVSDDRGGLVRFTLAGSDAASSTLAEPSQDAVPERIARLAWLNDGPQAGLWAATQAKLVRYAPDTTTADPVIRLADEGNPIRGLHRIASSDGTTLVAVTRPDAGGLVFWGLDGQARGELATDCRCETHALSFDGKTAACGCAPASEIRYGAVRWR